MLFNSFEFLIFFPIVVLLYFLSPYKLRVILLLVASCIFYMYFKPEYLLILFFLIIVDYFAGFFIAKAKGKKRLLYLILSLISNLGILFYFKYFNFFLENIFTILSNLYHTPPLSPMLSIILPLGLSFHTFQSMSYTIEIYKRKQKPEKNFLTYSLYVMFFPQLVAGPIERPQHLIPQFYKKHAFEYKRVTDGLKMMAWGFFLKLVIADRLAVYVDTVYNNSPTAQPGIAFILATLLFSYQIYCDFLGYSTIAMGAAKVLGFNLVNNFDRPYFSRSPAEFWRKWHISLSSWMRDYIYIPLGGNRVPVYIWPINILIVFIISGVWHGANWTFIIWGALHGFYIIAYLLIENICMRLPLIRAAWKTKVFKFFQVIITFLLVSFAWIFFRARNVQESWYIATHLLKDMDTYIPKIIYDSSRFHAIPLATIFEPITITRGVNDLIVAIIGIIVVEIVYYLGSGPDRWLILSKKPVYIRWTAYILLIWSIIVFGEFAKKQFIYFAF